ncbi:PBECR4 domain-containing protein [Butyrivibrio sp. AE3003]|uniref:PBECR4 domain-containing protein n=1 Tax=Butyrivibrio sp. AE3003 TaxID=1496721 RepID=UPI00047DCF6E|nr:PBECR4 domain-containing protein [Butyrivibrio sp. AE3003]
MENIVSFKERVKNCAIENAKIFNDNFVNFEYCIISRAFNDGGYYITKAFDGNYLHLVGVNTSMPADSFFKKCLDGTLTESDFDFVKRGVGKNALKGAVREKIHVLPNMVTIFEGKPINVQCSFKKNQVICAFASTDNKCTLGFSNSGHPKSLLKGDYLDDNKKFPVEAILRKTHESEIFDELVYNSGQNCSYIDKDLKNKITIEIWDKICK